MLDTEPSRIHLGAVKPRYNVERTKTRPQMTRTGALDRCQGIGPTHIGDERQPGILFNRRLAHTLELVTRYQLNLNQTTRSSRLTVAISCLNARLSPPESKGSDRSRDGT